MNSYRANQKKVWVGVVAWAIEKIVSITCQFFLYYGKGIGVPRHAIWKSYKC